MGAGLRYEHVHWRETSADVGDRSSGYDAFSVYAKAGFLHQLNERLAIDFSAGYAQTLRIILAGCPVISGCGLFLVKNVSVGKKPVRPGELVTGLNPAVHFI